MSFAEVRRLLSSRRHVLPPLCPSCLRVPAQGGHPCEMTPPAWRDETYLAKALPSLCGPEICDLTRLTFISFHLLKSRRSWNFEMRCGRLFCRLPVPSLSRGARVPSGAEAPPPERDAQAASYSTDSEPMHHFSSFEAIRRGGAQAASLQQQLAATEDEDRARTWRNYTKKGMFAEEADGGLGLSVRHSTGVGGPGWVGCVRRAARGNLYRMPTMASVHVRSDVRPDGFSLEY